MTTEDSGEATGAGERGTAPEASSHNCTDSEAGQSRAAELGTSDERTRKDRREALDALTAEAVADETYFLSPMPTRTR